MFYRVFGLSGEACSTTPSGSCSRALEISRQVAGLGHLHPFVGLMSFRPGRRLLNMREHRESQTFLSHLNDMSILTIPFVFTRRSFESQAQYKLRTGLRETRETMWQVKKAPRIASLYQLCVVDGALIMASTFGRSADRGSRRRSVATAMGTGSQLGQMSSITVIIYEFSRRRIGRSWWMHSQKVKPGIG